MNSVSQVPIVPSHKEPSSKITVFPKTNGVYKGIALSQLRLVRTIGTGTFGRVYLTRMNNDFFALKVLKKYDIVRLKQVEHVNSEKDILSTVNFPFIVKLICTFQDSSRVYMLEEFVVGGELFTHLRRAGRFSNQVTTFYAGQILLAIEHLHNLDIVYRDLKPENLLLDTEGNIKITDFGFAKRILDRTWTLCGTPEYLAPEIIQSKGHGKAVDYWALGVLIYEMLCGYPPFYDDNPFGIYEKILAGTINYPKHLIPEAISITGQLLTADITKRLGNLKGGAWDVKMHPWFSVMSWEALAERKIRAPIIPVTTHSGDSRNFDVYPESTEQETEPLGDPFQDLFPTF